MITFKATAVRTIQLRKKAMTQMKWKKVTGMNYGVDESTYYSFSIEECEDDEEWNEYSGEIYGEDKVLQQRGFEG